MNEANRMQYLEAMGVEVFVPRFVLPYAKPSVQCVLPVAEPSSIESEQLNPGSPLTTLTTLSSRMGLANESSGRHQDPNHILESRDTRAAQISPSRPNEKITDQPAQSTEPAEKTLEKVRENVEFNLILWRTEQLVMIDSITPGHALPTERLLRNICFALLGSTVNLSKPDRLSWPIPAASLDIASDWEAAQEWLNAYLDGIESKPNVMLHFGEDAYRALTGGQNDFKTRLFDMVEMSAVKHCLLPSLQELLYQPELKRPTWTMLQALNL